jgi:predicted permease
LFGRIDEGVSREDVDRDLAVLAERLHSQQPPADGTRQSFVATPLPRFGIGNAPDRDEEGVFVAFIGTALVGPSAVVLLIACINLANMFLARGAGRRTEVAIRHALGGGRLRLVRQFVAEGLLLALAGGVAGVLVANWAVRGLLSSLPTNLGIGALPSALLDVRPGWFVLAATLVSCLIATVLFALGPAWKVSGDVAATLKESVGASVGRRARTLLAPRNLVIVMQVALSLALLTAGGLFVRSAIEARGATPGFDLAPIVVAELDPSLLGYDEARSEEMFRQALDKARSIPGVESASLASRVHFSGLSNSRRVQVAGPAEPEASAIAHYYVVADDYFRTLALPVLRGRSFSAAEASSADGNRVAIIDEPLADRLFGASGDAVGRFIELPSGAANTETVATEVVGVVPGTKHNMTDRAASPHLYVPLGQVPPAERGFTTMHLQVRAAANLNSAALLEPLRNELGALDTAPPALSLQTMVALRDASLPMWAVRAGGRIFSLLGALALFLAVVGAYGVKAFLVTRRTREIGVRMALGATRGDVMRQMMRESLGLTVAGLVIGLLLAAVVARLLSALLYGVDPVDPLVMTISAAVLAAALLLAAYLPTRRATRIDPTTALRHE